MTDDPLGKAAAAAAASTAARLDRAANGPPGEPYRGADVTGMPPRDLTVPFNLQAAEDGVLKRLSRRRNRWPEVAKFDDRVAELEARAADLDRRLGELRAEAANAPTRDAEALASWTLAGEHGPRPEPTTPALEEQVARLAAERDALHIAVARVLDDKARCVGRHRDRLASDAEAAVAQAADRLRRLLDEAAAARAELAELRHAEVWARLYPDPAVGQTVHTGLLVGGLARPVRDLLGIDRQLDVTHVWEALHRDADGCAMPRPAISTPR